MQQASGYGSIDSPVMEEEVAGFARPVFLSDVHDTRRQGRRWRNRATRAALAMGAAAAVLGVAYTVQPRSSGVASFVEVRQSGPAGLAKDELAPLAFEAVNFYHVRDGKPAQDYPWLKDVKLVEPHRETTLSVSSPRDGHDYIWEVRGCEADKAGVRATARGAEATVTLTELGRNMIVVMEVDSAGVVVRRLQEAIMVKYVRREIRTLTDDEREELFDAMHQLWAAKVDGGNGKELYGEDFADIWAINRLHFKAGMNITCDHFHDGLGFLTTHSMVTNTFEFSLQLVNPKLTVPYWDWTIEEVEAERDYSVTGQFEIKSPLFQASWFGAADPDDWVVKDGRWAYTKIPSMYDGNPGGDLVPDVYGQLRSRWTANDSPFVTRGLGQYCDQPVTDTLPWPTCDTHLSLVTEYPDWYGWVCQSQHTPHGNVHVWIGGMLNCDEMLGNLSELVGKDNADLLKINAFDRKGYWREELYQCEGVASMDTPIDEVYARGQCGCLGYDLTQGDDWKTIYYNSTGDFDSYISEYDDDTKRRVIAEICSSTTTNGEHLHAGSSPDPSFWPMHPTMERLFMYSLLTGRMTDLTWPDTDDESASGAISDYGDTCVGHAGSDVFPFGMLDTDIDGFEIKTGIKGNLRTGNLLTNREILAALDARIDMLPYVYDTFKWDHCLEVGVDFNDAWSSADSSTAAKTEETT